MSMRAFTVDLVEERDVNGGTAFTRMRLDTVFDLERNPVAVKRQLVARGEFPPNIYVKRARRQ